MKGKLFLIPTILADETQQEVIPHHVREAIKTTQHFLCENVRTARRFISSLKIHNAIDTLKFEVLDKDTKIEQVAGLMAPLLDGKNMGVLSESGCPGIADPGALAVQYCHTKNITVVPLVGPSSITLALMASGLNGQQFAFHGYLPIEANRVASTIKKLEQESRDKNQTQIFIETPFRNQSLFSHLVNSLKPETMLCVASQLTSPQEKIASMKVAEWKKHPFKFEKEPAVFLFLAHADGVGK